MSRPSWPLILLVSSAACSGGRCAPGKAATDDAGAIPASTAASPSSSASAHPDVVTEASGAWDAGPSVIARDVVDGALLRKKTRARIAGDRSAVHVIEGSAALELGRAACEAVVPKRPVDTPILIKPNIGGFEWFKDPKTHDGDDGVTGRTTDPEIVRGIVRCLKARGHKRVTIAEGWGAKHADWERLVRASGYAAMAEQEGVPLVAMDDDGVFDEVGDKPGRPLGVRGMEQTHAPTLLLPKILAEHLDHGMFISVPKLKTHRFGVVSVGIKGMQGTVMLSDASPAFRQKWRMHRELSPALELLATDRDAGESAYLASLRVFAERMSDVLEISAPHVVIADGAPAMGGDGFQKLWPSRESFVVAGTNPVTVDRVAAQTLGLWDNAALAEKLGGHRTSPLIETAARRFGVDLSQVEITGSGAHLAKPGRPVHYLSMSGFALHSDATPSATADRYRLSAGAGAAPQAQAHHFDAEPTIDGVVDASWAKAKPVVWDTDWSGARRGVRTTARLGWTDAALFALFELEGAGVNVDASRPKDVERARLYEEDCVELFVAADAKDPLRYFEVEVGPLGHFLDLAVDRHRKTSDVSWSSEPVIATKVDRAAGRVVIEIAIRAKGVTRGLTKGARLPFALYRMEGVKPQRMYLAWSPTLTPKPNFHVPERFGVLRLD